MDAVRRLVVLALLGALTVACTSPAPRPPAHTATPAPAPTLAATPSPTATPLPSPTPDPMAALEGRRLAAVFSGAISDNSWTAAAYRAIDELRTRYGIEFAWTENADAAAGERALREYAEAGYDYVLAHGAEWDAAIAAVAPKHPDVRFIQTNGSEGGLANVYTVSFSAGEGGYFAGMIACLASKTGKAGYVAGVTYPILDHQIAMSRQACKDLGKNVEFVESYTGNWHDALRTKELARAAIENGADVLILHAEDADAGTIEAAREALAGGKQILLLSWSRDKHALASDLVAGGWQERAGRLIEYALQRLARGEPGGHFALGVAEGAAELTPFYGLLPAEIEKQVMDAFEGYRRDPASLPSLVVRTDL